ncbi:MAG TPA: hypothetical protein VLL72_09390 [Kiloniellales bacterium]|nr:hypothetical protein [Kiloniellales bacterium]
MPSSLPSPRARLSAAAVVTAVLAGVLYFAEGLAVGLALDWSLVGLFDLPPLGYAVGAVPVVLGSLAAGFWMTRRGLDSEAALAEEAARG